MSYEECLRATISDPQSWSVLVIGLVLTVILKRFGRHYSGLAMLVATAGFSFIWAYGFYELNCVELLS